MKISSTYHLSCNVRSSVKSDVLYGKCNEQVTILADHGEVLIVQGECGRFPVRKEFLSEVPVILDDEPEFIPQKVPSKKQPTKKQFSTPSTLF